MFIIENDFLTVGVNPFGAELWSVVSKENGKEYIWQGNPEIWNGRAPVLFPICGRLSGDSYEYGGKSFHVYQIFAVVGRSGYVFTYTAREDSYAKHFEDVTRIIGKVVF